MDLRALDARSDIGTQDIVRTFPDGVDLRVTQ
jgi:hypothetical protein